MTATRTRHRRTRASYRKTLQVPGDNPPVRVTASAEGDWPEVVLAVGAARVVMDDPDQVESVRQQLHTALARATAVVAAADQDPRQHGRRATARRRVFRRVVDTGGTDPTAPAVSVEGQVGDGGPVVVLEVGGTGVTVTASADAAALRRWLWTAFGYATTAVSWAGAADLTLGGC